MSTAPRDIAELEPVELESALAESGCEAFHARQIFRWIYRYGVTDFGRMTDLSRTLRLRLPDDFVVNTPRIVGDETSTDGTRKLALELGDGRRIESVFLPATPAMTFGISTLYVGIR